MRSVKDILASVVSVSEYSLLDCPFAIRVQLHLEEGLQKAHDDG